MTNLGDIFHPCGRWKIGIQLKMPPVGRICSALTWARFARGFLRRGQRGWRNVGHSCWHPALKNRSSLPLSGGLYLVLSEPRHNPPYTCCPIG